MSLLTTLRHARTDVLLPPSTTPLPGDDLLARTAPSTTHAIDVAAPPSQVWPWLVQMGVGRAGWYAIDLVDNLGRPSATTIEPAWQRLEVGDVLPATPSGRLGFEVVALRRPTWMVLRTGGRRLTSTWALHLLATLHGTRLTSRLRLDTDPHGLRPLAALLLAPVHGVMQRVQLCNVRDRAEGRVGTS